MQVDLNRDKYKLFTKSDFQNIIGKSLDELLENEGSNDNAEYMLTYVSIAIMKFISKRTGKQLYKSYTNSPDDYTLRFGFSNSSYEDANGNTIYSSVKLTDKQIEDIKLACVYQADYIIENGAPERMSGLSISARTAVLSKKDLTSYEICDIAYQCLLESGLLYAGVGVGLNAWFK